MRSCGYVCRIPRNPYKSYKELIAQDLKPGDLIEINRVYTSNWVMFAERERDNYWCFHVVPIDDGWSCGTLLATKAVVKKSKLEDVMDAHAMALVENKIVEARKRKYATRAIRTVLNDLEKQIGKTVPYSVVKLSCEEYVTRWKYREGWRARVNTAMQFIRRIFRC